MCQIDVRRFFSRVDSYKAVAVPVKHVTVPAGLVVPSVPYVWKLAVPETEWVVTPLGLPAEVAGKQVACPYKVVAYKV